MKRARVLLAALMLLVMCAPVAQPARALVLNPLNGLQHYWSLDEVSGVRYTEVGTLNLTDNNTVGSIAGKVGLAASFVATNTESLSASAAVNLLPITVNAWFNPNYIVAGQRALGSISSNPTSGFAMRHNNDNTQWYALYQKDTSNYATVQSTIVPNTWFMGTLIVEQGGLIYCINTVCKNGTTVGIIDISNATSVFRIGGYLTISNYDGLIDEVGIWDRALTTAEIAALYNNNTGLSYDDMRRLYGVSDIEDGTLSDATDSAQMVLNSLLGLFGYVIGLALGLAIVIVIMRMFKWM